MGKVSIVLHRKCLKLNGSSFFNLLDVNDVFFLLKIYKVYREIIIITTPKRFFEMLIFWHQNFIGYFPASYGCHSFPFCRNIYLDKRI
jgi:hypothetical protein